MAARATSQCWGLRPDDGAVIPADVRIIEVAVTATGDVGTIDVTEAGVVPLLALLALEGWEAAVRARTRVVGVDGLAVFVIQLEAIRDAMDAR